MIILSIITDNNLIFRRSFLIIINDHLNPANSHSSSHNNHSTMPATMPPLQPKHPNLPSLHHQPPPNFPWPMSTLINTSLLPLPNTRTVSEVHTHLQVIEQYLHPLVFRMFDQPHNNYLPTLPPRTHTHQQHLPRNSQLHR